MPLSPYLYQPAGSKHTTPSPTIPQGGHNRRGSNASFWSSSESIDTRATSPSPNISPEKYLGRDILPKIRPCDQIYEPEIPLELDPLYNFPEFDYGFQDASSSTCQRASTCPPEYETFTTSTAPSEPWAYSTDSTQFYAPVIRSGSVGHGRSSSASAINPASLRPPYAAPYRTAPQYITQSQSQYNSLTVPQPGDFLDNPFTLPMHPGPSDPHPLNRELTPDFAFETPDDPTTTLMSFLTAPSPKCRLIPNASRYHHAENQDIKFYWWDIRQVHTWKSFSLSNIMEHPGFSRLLNISVRANPLQEPLVPSHLLDPKCENSLAALIDSFYAKKLEAALKITQGEERRAHLSFNGKPPNGPHFLAQYVQDATNLHSRARCVGLVKAYGEWNTGMGSHRSNPNDHVKYLRGLAQLQHKMRDQNCRYGFLITEIELVCVRFPPCPSERDSDGHRRRSNVPLFGSLEISKAIPLSRQGDEGLTPCLALWYLCMLTSDTPLDGQEHWQVDIGAPAALTRSKCCADEDRDKWIRNIKGPQITETRLAKKRGWVWPGDKYDIKKEGQGAKRVRANRRA